MTKTLVGSWWGLALLLSFAPAAAQAQWMAHSISLPEAYGPVAYLNFRCNNETGAHEVLTYAGWFAGDAEMMGRVRAQCAADRQAHTDALAREAEEKRIADAYVAEHAAECASFRADPTNARWDSHPQRFILRARCTRVAEIQTGGGTGTGEARLMCTTVMSADQADAYKFSRMAGAAVKAGDYVESARLYGLANEALRRFHANRTGSATGTQQCRMVATTSAPRPMAPIALAAPRIPAHRCTETGCEILGGEAN